MNLLFVLALSVLGISSASVPRKSPDFTIQQAPDKTTMLSSYKGKVVMLEFFFMRSQICVDLARTMDKLNRELGPQGFQPVAIAFPSPQSDANAALVNYMVNYFKLSYPVGYTDKDAVDRYLGRQPKEMLRIPQVVIIDRNGMIRAQTGINDTQLESETYLRFFLNNLLKEGAPANSAKK